MFASNFRRTVSSESTGEPGDSNSGKTSPRSAQSPRMTGLIGLRAIPGRIRALAKAVHDDTQFEELRHPSSNAFRMTSALRVLDDMGIHLSAEELLLFDVAVTEYAQQLQGVNPFFVKREAVSSVLQLTASIDAEAAYAGVSVPTMMDAVVRTHAVYMNFINTVLPLSGVAAFTAYSGVIVELLKPLEEAIKQFASRRGAKFQPNDPKVRIANGRLWRIANEIDRVVPAMLQTVIFDSHEVLQDRGAQEVWDRLVGRTVPIVSAMKAGLLFEGFPPTLVEPLLKILDVGNVGYVTVHGFADLLKVWGPFAVLPETFFRDVVTGALCLDAAPEEAELHLMGDRALYRGQDAGDRRRWMEEASVIGSVAAAKALEGADDTTQPRKGNYCISMGRDPGRLHIHVLDAACKPMVFDLLRDNGAWQIIGFSREHFESIHDACAAYSNVLTHAVGHDENVKWYVDRLPPMDTACHALHRACYCNNLPFVEHLLRMGSDVVVNVAMADPVLVPSEFMWTPLQFAVNSPCGDPHRIVRLLLSAGARVDSIDEAGCTALYYVIANGYGETLRLLLQTNPTLISSLSTDRVLMSLGAHHFISDDNDVRRLAAAPLCPDIVQQLLRYEDDADFILLCSAIVDAKLLGVPLLPDPSLQTHTSANPRLVHLKSRTIVTPAQQQQVDELIATHGKLVRRDCSARKTQTVLQHKLFQLSITAHFQRLREPFHESRPATPASMDDPQTGGNSPALLSPASSRRIDRWKGGWRRSSLALSTAGDDDSDVLMSSRELVQARRRFSLATSPTSTDPTPRRSSHRFV
jgi:ankyrin repeat protein